MNIQIESDWHLETHRDAGKSFIQSLDPTGVDVLVLAGDIVSLKLREATEYVLSLLCARFEDVDIVYVPGNHEFWGSDTEEAWGFLRAIQMRTPNLHALRNEIVQIAGKRFLGGTMWFPRGGERYADLMPDFELIRGFVPWVYAEHQGFVDMLAHQLREGDIVVTHHTPSPLSIPKRFIGLPVNHFFMSNQEQYILERKPALWVHGHSHDAMDYRLGSTRILSNPFGYLYASRGQYREGLCVEL